MADVSRTLTRERLLSIIKLANSAAVDLGIKAPRIGVAGLNPHSSDGGLFGDEEARIISPAIEDAKALGHECKRPGGLRIPMFMKLRGGAWDVCVAMYHDQGHIPVKMMGWFWDESKRTWTAMSGVAVTVGLPIIRTNPDHGTAFEVGRQGNCHSSSDVRGDRGSPWRWRMAEVLFESRRKQQPGECGNRRSSNYQELIAVQPMPRHEY